MRNGSMKKERNKNTNKMMGNKEQILCSQKTETLLSALREEYDAIFLHTPSLTAPVSGKILCRLADAVVLVVAMRKTKKAQ